MPDAKHTPFPKRAQGEREGDYNSRLFAWVLNNLPLISAAPEMYEALDDCIDFLESIADELEAEVGTDSDAAQAWELLVRCREIQRKARGESDE